MKGTASWAVLFLFAVILLILGFTGGVGKLLAVIFTPSMLRDLNEEGAFDEEPTGNL